MEQAGLHLLLGPDRSKKLERVQQLERELGVGALDRHQLDAATAPAQELLALCRQQPAASRARLIVVDRAERLSEACVEALLQHAETIAQSACVVLLVETELSVRHPLARAAELMRAERFAARETPVVKPFALVEALGRRDAAEALAAAQDQLLAGKDPLELFSLIAWQLQRWVLVKRWVLAGRRPEQVAAATGLKPWQVERIRGEVADRSLASLQGLLSRCWQVEHDVKRGRAMAPLALDALMLEVCAGEPAHV